MIVPIPMNTKLGIHDASNGPMPPTLARLRLVIIKIIYTKANKKPKAIVNPAPSLDLRDAAITPINVKIITENGYVYRWYFSTI